jgi:hypothetical protein
LRSLQYVKIGPVTVSGDLDGSTLLTSAEVKDLLSAAVRHAGGRLVSWRLDHWLYRGQEPNWEAETARMIESAVSLVQSSVRV